VHGAALRAVEAIRAAAGNDVYYAFAGEDERFLGEPETLMIAGWFLHCFLSGFVAGGKSQTEELGRRLADWLAAKVERSRSWRPGTSPTASRDQASSELAPVLIEARKVASGRSADDVAALAKHAEKEMFQLLYDRQMTPTAARRLAAAIRQAGVAAVNDV
jgi:hypothetical protein